MSPVARHRWRVARRLLSAGFLLFVAYLLVAYARRVDWSEVLAALQALHPGRLATAVLLAALSHLVYACFDLVGRAYTRHRIPAHRVMAVSFISYAFNLNFGALIGGVAFRYRLYARLGLKGAVTTQVLSLSVVTNWLGYVILAGIVLLAGVLPLPASWGLSRPLTFTTGLLLLLTALTYLLFCAGLRRRSWKLRSLELMLPSLPMAAAQLVLSLLNWLLIAAIVFVLLGGAAAYPAVLAVLLSGSIAGAVTHVPAGLGVVEAVFLALLGGEIAQGELLAALLAYRAVYYLGPLLVALAVFLALESRARRSRVPAAAQAR